MSLSPRQSIPEKTWLPLAALIVAMLLWGSSLVALKIAFRDYHPMVVIFGRMLVASLCFLFLLPGFLKLSLTRQDIKYLLLMSVFEPCLYFVFEARAIENTTASQAGMITAMLPLMVAVGAWLILKERITRQALIGFFIAVVGAGWLSLAGEQNESAPNPILGNFYEFLAMVCAAGYTIVLKHLSTRFPVSFLTASQAFIGSLFFFPFLFLPGTNLPESMLLVPTLATLYLGIFVTLLAYGLYNYGVSQIPASQAAGFINLIPVFSVLLGMLILGETMTFGQWCASGLVFGAVLISRRESTAAVSTYT